MTEREDNHKDYEIAFLLSEESDLKGLLDILKQHEATITFEGPLKKIALAYEIKKQSSAHFGFIRFTAPPAQIPSLEQVLVLHQPVLRSLIVTYVPGRATVPRDPSAVPVIAAASLADATPVVVEPAVVTPGHSLPLSNEDLEKRIEEILK